nr:phage terminase small subunit [uncultured Mogibacterium sp.]
MAKEKYELAEQDYMNGMKYKDIADKYGVSLNTVKSWKKRYNWDRKGCTQKKKKGAHKNAIAQLGNKNATGPAGNKNAEKYGFFSKYLPEETLDIIQAVEKANPLDLLWHQIQIAYAAIIRAQRIAFVENEYDKTIEQVEAKKGNIVGAKWEVQQAWDKQNNFLKAQARAQGELRSLIKQYDEMLHRDWDKATEEQKSRVEYIKSKTAAVNKALTGEGAIGGNITVQFVGYDDVEE